MKKTLRSNSVNNFMRRAHWLTLGLNDEDMEKPKIAVVSRKHARACQQHKNVANGPAGRRKNRADGMGKSETARYLDA